MAGPGPGPLCPPFLSPSMLRLTPDVTPDVCHRPDSVVTVCRAPRPGVDWLSLEALRQRWPGLGPPVEMSSSPLYSLVPVLSPLAPHSPICSHCSLYITSSYHHTISLTLCTRGIIRTSFLFTGHYHYYHHQKLSMY